MEVRNMNRMKKNYKPLNCNQIMAVVLNLFTLRRDFSRKIKGCCDDYLHLLPIGR